MKLDLIAFAAHPDDAELACSGTLHKHIQLGKKVGIVDLTRGELGSRGSAEIRDQESSDAAKILGLHARENLGLADGFFSNNKDTQLKVIASLRKYQPEIILINAPYDRHPDHGKGAALLIDASFLSGLIKIETTDAETGEPQKAWRPKRIFHYVQDTTIEPSIIVDISDSFEVKLQSILAYKSQFNAVLGDGPQTYISNQGFLDEIEGRARSMGKRIGTKYGEGLIRPKNANVGIRNLFDQILPEFV
jgi:N-acetylglucosamine malate deacetylase 1